MYNYAIYHRNCLDGFASLIILIKSKKLQNDSIIFKDVPFAKIIPKDIKDKNNILKEIVEQANTVTFIDHHVTIKDDIDLLQNKYPNKLKIIYDVNESGASLTWKFFFGKKNFPLFVKYIKDADIGKWELKNTKFFNYGLNVRFHISDKHENIQKWLSLFDSKIIYELIKKGKIYGEYVEYLLETSSNRYSLEMFPSDIIYEKFTDHFNKPGEYKVAVVCGGGCPSSSLLGSYMVKKINCDFILFWDYNMEKQEYIISLRSDKVDVGTIAKIFNGGGHTYASACSFLAKSFHIFDLFYPNSLPREK